MSVIRVPNLNEAPLLDDDTGKNISVDNSLVVGASRIAVYFRSLEARLSEHIQKADAVFGCIAWLTSKNIIGKLIEKDTCIIVQKEDFLRPDMGARSNWRRELRAAYDRLHCRLERPSFGNIIRSLQTNADPEVQPIRCVGNHNSEKQPAFPRMHNKFLVFSRVLSTGPFNYPKIEPYGVWTGSFNLTKNATASLENAIYTEIPEVVDAYFNEFGQIVALSEPLDWTSDWIAPEWRIGT
jgi:hypothetical protein